MTRVRVERVGGLAGFGGPRSHLASRGEVDVATLGEVDQRVVAELFTRARSGGAASQARDGFSYRVTRTDDAGADHTIEVAEHELPAALLQCMRDEVV